MAQFVRSLLLEALDNGEIRAIVIEQENDPDYCPASISDIVQGDVESVKAWVSEYNDWAVIPLTGVYNGGFLPMDSGELTIWEAAELFIISGQN